MTKFWEKFKNEEEFISYLHGYINTKKKIIISYDDIKNLYFSLKVQRLVILNSKPGMGKTELCNGMVDAFISLFGSDAVKKIFVSIEKNYEKSDLLGYQGLDEKYYPSKFARELFALDENGRPQKPSDFRIYFVILDEMNLGQIDEYFAKVLTAIENNEEIELPNNAVVSLPENAFFFGTINSYTIESSRNPISGSVKRRTNIITVKNPLYELMEGASDAEQLGAFKDIISQIFAQSKTNFETKQDFLNYFRTMDFDALETVVTEDDFCKPLFDLVMSFSDYEETKLTIGILQDIIEYLLFSNFEYYHSLDIQIVQKILPQMAGSIEKYSRLEEFLDSYDFPQSKDLFLKMKLEAEQNIGQIVPLC